MFFFFYFKVFCGSHTLAPRGHIVACELFLHGLRGLSLADITLVRNTQLTHSVLR